MRFTTHQNLQMKNIGKIFMAGVCFASCTVQKNIKLTEQSRLTLIGQYIVPHNRIFEGTTIGGLSGIDYDKKSGLYYLVCDDRSAINPARFYTAKIHLNEKAGLSNGQGIDSVEFVSVKTLVQQNGQPYPSSKQDPLKAPDPEAMRYDVKRKRLVWSSEGERLIKGDTIALQDPFIHITSTRGQYIDSFVLPENMHMRPIQKGPRQNGVFEGLSFANNYRHLLVSVEESLYEDGHRAGLNDSSAWTRIIKYKVRSGELLGQYGYRIDPVAYPPYPEGAFKVNGIPDILAINQTQWLVVERSFSSGRKRCTIKVYLAEAGAAQDISRYTSLKDLSFHPIQKKLLLNMDELGIYIDNIEGVTQGPRLPNGRQTLIFVADNNFSEDEITQFLLFEIE